MGYNCFLTKVRDGEITTLEGFTDEALIDVDAGTSLLIGPTALWRQAIRASKKNKVKSNSNIEVRGIPAKSFSFTDKNSMKYELFFSDGSWSSLSVKEKATPLRITVVGTVNKTAVDLTFDYYVFEKFDPAYFINLLVTGVGCKVEQHTPPGIFPKIPWSDFSVEMEVVETSFGDTAPIEMGAIYCNVYLDLLNNISRTDITTVLFKDTVIHDLSRDIIYNKKPNGDCLMNTQDGVDLDIMDYDKLKTISDLLLMNLDYYYLGREKGAIAESLGNQLPVKFERTGYVLQDGLYQLKLKQNFNLFNIQKLYLGKNVQDIFNIENCIVNENDKKYFIFSSILDEHLTHMDTRYAARVASLVKRRLTEILTNNYSISALRIPFMDFNYQNRSIRIEAMVLETPSLLSSFDKKEDRKPSTKDQMLEITDLEECAKQAIKKETLTGFKFCGQRCFLLTYDINEKTDVSEDTTCEFYVLRKIRVKGKVLAAEPDLNSLKDKLFATKNTLSIDVKWGRNLENTILIPISDIVVSDASTNLLTGDLLYTKTVTDSQLQMTSNSVSIATAKTLGDCYTLCKNLKDIECQSFSFCNSEPKECRLSSVFIKDDTQTEVVKNNTESKEDCNVYSMNYLNKYEKLPGKRDLLLGFVSLESEKLAHECAKACSAQDKCLSFQFCDSGLCALSRVSYRDFSSRDLLTTYDNESCEIYDVKDVNLFVYTGNDLVAEFDKSYNDIGIEQCAQLCDELDKEANARCLSFNYCPGSTQSVCQLSSQSVLHGAKTIKNTLCKNFDRNSPKKKPPVDPSTNTEQQTNNADAGKMSQKSFMGLILGMFFVGIVLGVIGFFAYGIYKKRRNENDGFGVSVRFIRHQDE
ncbi:hypothetical protein B4U80_12783 [Leptotrombidium deliense]|uniref:Apple domain-containing protein n=1 Tax=Leptotrombidium deliense TaxID=299467 RepID=A0A443SM33_9ACAR|nr:hypothetical protein B4U80_12783 [Leptotrombidium deliense]